MIEELWVVKQIEPVVVDSDSSNDLVEQLIRRVYRFLLKHHDLKLKSNQHYSPANPLSITPTASGGKLDIMDEPNL